MTVERERTHLSLIDHVKKEIAKTGFPLEITVLNTCSTKNTGRIPNYRYEYEGRPREIDLLTHFETMFHEATKKENVQYTTTMIVIECKKSQAKPWVFFSSAMYERFPEAGRVKYSSDFNQYFKTVGRHSLLGQMVMSLENNHYNDMKVPICLTYFEVDKNPKAPSEIYAAVDSVLCFLRYALENDYAGLDEEGSITTFYYPVIVLDGTLFVATIKGEELDVQEKNHIMLRTNHAGVSYMVDVVTKDYFSTFFDMVEKDHREFVSCINKVRFPKKHVIAMTARDAARVMEGGKRKEEGIDYQRLSRKP